MANVVGPVFVAGCPRSGTSALSWAIAAHPQYWTSAETHFFYYLLRDTAIHKAYAVSSHPGSWLDRHEVSASEFLFHLGAGLGRMMRSRSQGRDWVDGSPENILVGDDLLEMYPDAVMIHVVRDPRAVCSSMLASGFEPDWARDLGAAIKTWLHYAGAGLRLEKARPGRVLRIKQEDMAGNTLVVADRLRDCLKLENADPIREFLATRRVNSSYDRASYVHDSPFKDVIRSISDPTDAAATRETQIIAATADLAALLGYSLSADTSL
jgi:hypothetical protein